MDNLYVKAVLAGFVFGVWPLLMNRSGLNGNVASFVFTSVVLVCVFPFALGGGLGNIFNANWILTISAGILGAVGMLLFNGMLVKATPQNVSSLFVLMLVVQIAAPAIYQVAMEGMTMMKGAGFALAAIAAVLLLL
jgi:hypothetical protein